MPALLIRMSNPPSCSVTSAIAASTEAAVALVQPDQCRFPACRSDDLRGPLRPLPPGAIADRNVNAVPRQRGGNDASEATLTRP